MDFLLQPGLRCEDWRISVARRRSGRVDGLRHHRRNRRRHCRRAKRCSTAPWGRGASANRRRSCAAAASRRKAWPSSHAMRTGASSARCRLWDVAAGVGARALLLGPLAVDPSLKNAGIGSALMRHAIAEAAPARPSRDPAGRRRAILRALRLLGGKDRLARHARPV